MPTKTEIATEKAANALARVTELETKMQTLSSDVDALKDKVAILASSVDNVDVISLSKSVERLLKLIDGDIQYGIAGLRQDVGDIRSITEVIVEDRKRFRWIMIGVGLTGITNVGTFVTILTKVLDGGF